MKYKFGDNNYSCSYLHCANRVGLFFTALFVLCFAWYFIQPVERELHLSLFKLSFLGFNGMNGLSFILAVVQSYIWGYIVVGLWRLVGCCSCKGESKE